MTYYVTQADYERRQRSVALASYSIRKKAYALDCLVCSCLTILVGILCSWIVSGQGLMASFEWGWAGTVLAGAAYWIWPQASSWQASPGKRHYGLRVTTIEGDDLTIFTSIGRYIAGYVSLLPFGMGLVMASWRRDGAALHDLMCGTRVVVDDRERW